MSSNNGAALKTINQSLVVRLFGVLLLLILISRLDLHKAHVVLSHARWNLVSLAVLLNIPLIGLKTIRWRQLLFAQGIVYGFRQAFGAYFGSIFIGLLTPGRLGEFVKTAHISQDCRVPTASAFSSVLVDRLFDAYALLLVGGAAVLSLTVGNIGVLALTGSALALTLSLTLFLSNSSFNYLQMIGLRLGRLGRKLFAAESWLVEMRHGVRQLTWPSLLAAIGLTVVAYTIFFGQCYVLALALNLPAGFVSVSYAVALGSLVTLLPISISGLGTREAAMVAYLGTAGVPAEAALAFSLLVFATFYVAGGLMGAVAWWLKPLPVRFGDLSGKK